MNWEWLFTLRGELNKRQSFWLAAAGLIFTLLIWALVTSGEHPLINKTAFPHPVKVLNAFRDLYVENELIKNIARSVGLNLGGYIKAILYAVPVGFLIGLVPLLRGAFQRMVDAVRFLPLTALTIMFIVWYGIYAEAKINFLAFGIFIYLLPIVVQRIDEVDDVYLKTVYTLGANYWQTIRTVYLPAVMSRLSDDIRILTAISWTYIIVAETSADQGGIGSLIYRTGQRMSRVDKTIACLIIIMLIGIFQDIIFKYLDRKFFLHKYQLKPDFESKRLLKETSLVDVVSGFTLTILTWVFLGVYLVFTANEYFSFLGNIKPLSYLFGETLWTVDVLFFSILAYQLYQLYLKIISK